MAIFRIRGAEHRNTVALGQFGRDRSNVWSYPGVGGYGRDRAAALAMHPTVKLVALVADALRDCTLRGERVLDPFLGSGTTVIAAKKVGRVAYGLEYDAGYVDTIVRRWQAYTGMDAILLGTESPFAEVEANRTAEARDQQEPQDPEQEAASQAAVVQESAPAEAAGGGNNGGEGAPEANAEDDTTGEGLALRDAAE